MTNRGTRQARRAAVRRLAAKQGGVLTASQLAGTGISRSAVRAELGAGRLQTASGGTLDASGTVPRDADLWRAVLATAPRSGAHDVARAALGGLTALQAAGLSGISGDGLIHVAAPKSSRPLRTLPGVRVHETRRWRDEDVVGRGIPRMRPAVAVLQAAFWARSDREATLLVCAPLQQRLVTVPQVAQALELVLRARRRTLVRGLLAEFAGGVHSLNELDLAGLCRRAGFPEPDRQVVLRRPGGSYYVDVRWSRWGVVVEVDGVGHLAVDAWLKDSLRHNEIALTEGIVLRIPSIGLRTDPAAYLENIRRALLAAGWRP